MEIAEAYIKFQKSLYGYIFSKVNHKEDAEDILQNVFVKIQSKISTLADKDKMQNWLYRITRNTIIDYYRSKATKKIELELKEQWGHDLPEDELPDHTKGLDKCLLGFIEQLPDEYRMIINDAEIRGISQKALAEKYQLAYPTLRSRVQRGRERLHKMMVACCRIESDKRGNILEASLINKCDETPDCCA
jgi:RNA polymerase sigma-70 factor, ECF subfamily